jgi:hypothetical protein
MDEPTTSLLERAVDGLDAPDDLLARVIRRKAVRQRRRRAGAALLALGIAAGGFAGAFVAFHAPRSPRPPGTATHQAPRSPSAPGMTTYRDVEGAFEIDRPVSFRHGTFSELGGGSSSLWFANFPAAFGGAGAFPTHIPEDGVILEIIRSDGPLVPVERMPDTALPLSTRDLRPSTHRWSRINVIANGEQYLLWLHVSAGATPEDRAAARAVIPSLRFLPLRTGTASEGAITYYVLDVPERYPIGSVTRFDRTNLPRSSSSRPFPFYLVHAGEGFYALAWPGDLVHGYKDCDVTYDDSVGQFWCSNGARWALDGSVLAKPGAKYRDDRLSVLGVRISLDGQVLVSPDLFLSGIADDLRLTGG